MAGITKSYYEYGILKKVTKIYVRGIKLEEQAKSFQRNEEVKEKTLFKDGKSVGLAKL